MMERDIVRPQMWVLACVCAIGWMTGCSNALPVKPPTEEEIKAYNESSQKTIQEMAKKYKNYRPPNTSGGGAHAGAHR
jgi:hypothetical protein